MSVRVNDDVLSGIDRIQVDGFGIESFHHRIASLRIDFSIRIRNGYFRPSFFFLEFLSILLKRRCFRLGLFLTGGDFFRLYNADLGTLSIIYIVPIDGNFSSSVIFGVYNFTWAPLLFLIRELGEVRDG